MAATWEITRKYVNKDTSLVKITAIRTEDGKSRSFKVKSYMETAEQQIAVWDNIYQQHLDAVANDPNPDVIAIEGKSNLESREV